MIGCKFQQMFPSGERGSGGGGDGLRLRGPKSILMFPGILRNPHFSPSPSLPGPLATTPPQEKGFYNSYSDLHSRSVFIY